RVVINIKAVDIAADGDGAYFQVHGDFHITGFALLPNQLNIFLLYQPSQHASLAGVATEDIGNAGRKYRLEPVIAQGPNRALPPGTGTEVGASKKHGALVERFLVQHKVFIFAPVGKQAILKACALDGLEIDRRDDLVGIDIGIAQGNANAGVRDELFHVIKIPLLIVFV